MKIRAGRSEGKEVLFILIGITAVKRMFAT